jgi:hypothetical protein
MPTTRRSTRQRQAAAQEKKKKKAEGEQFRRRRINHGFKSQDLVDICGAKMYFKLERRDHIWEYNSEPHDGPWPRDRGELVSVFQ